MTAEQKENIAVEIEESGVFKPITFAKFVPHNTNKFTREVDGAVIAHEENKLDSMRFYNFKVVLGIGEKISKLISILPFKASADKETRAVYLHAYDKKQGSWAKVNGEYDEEGNFRLLVK